MKKLFLLSVLTSTVGFVNISFATVADYPILTVEKIVDFPRNTNCFNTDKTVVEVKESILVAQFNSDDGHGIRNKNMRKQLRDLQKQTEPRPTPPKIKGKARGWHPPMHPDYKPKK